MYPTVVFCKHSQLSFELISAHIKMSPALVSVCIPTYRGSAFLAAAIDSVLSQSYPHHEIWILDDNSPDDTQAIVSRYSDPRIKYLRNPKNLGPGGNWNRCLEVAQGKYFKLLPHDDLLAPRCLEEQVSVLEDDSAGKIALVFGFRQIIDPSGRILMTRKLCPHEGRQYKWSHADQALHPCWNQPDRRTRKRTISP
jgi:glycosyltransferase involved in cell wall biosynthesis